MLTFADDNNDDKIHIADIDTISNEVVPRGKEERLQETLTQYACIIIWMIQIGICGTYDNNVLINVDWSFFKLFQELPYNSLKIS